MINFFGIRRGDVFFADLDKRRPCVIVSNNKLNTSSQNVIVVPLSSNLKRLDLPSHVVLCRKINNVVAMAMTEILYQIKKEQLHNYVCTLSEKDLNKINQSIKITLELNEL